jgi:hypothetical protein
LCHGEGPIEVETIDLTTMFSHNNAVKIARYQVQRRVRRKIPESSFALVTRRRSLRGQIPWDAAFYSTSPSTLSSSRSVSPEEVLANFATLDYRRAERTGFPEAVFAQGKTPMQVATILDDLARHVNETTLELQQQQQERGDGTNHVLSLNRAMLATR